MLPLLLLLLATAHGLGESTNAIGLGWGSPGSPVHRHQDPQSLEVQGS